MRYALPLSLLCLLVACSGLKLSKDANCLNEKSGCFKPDITAPQLKQSVLPPPGVYVSTLSEIHLMFSEELNNPQPSDFTFTGGDLGMQITSVTKINQFTYRLLTNRNPVIGGDLQLAFPNLKDYSGNKITNGSVTLKINLDIPIILDSVNRYAISGLAPLPPTVPGSPPSNPPGYQTITANWHFNYTPIVGGNTVYHLRRSSAVDCSSGTALTPTVTPTPAVNSTVQTYDITSPATIAATTYNFSLNKTDIPFNAPNGRIYILICLTNLNNNKTGVQFIDVTHDNTNPVLSMTPTGGNYQAPQTLTISCSDNFDRIAYGVETTTNGSTPLASAITDPAFHAETGALTTMSTEVSTNPLMIQTPYTADPTKSIFKFRCIDRAGNPSAVLTSGVFGINSTYPIINIVGITKTSYTPVRTIAGIGTGGHTSATLTWNTNQVLAEYEIRANGTDCGAGGTQLEYSAAAAPGTPGTAFTNKTIAITPAMLGNVEQTHTIRVCVHNGTEWGQVNVPLLLDNSAPTTSVNVVAGDYGAQQNLVFSCEDNVDKIAYDIQTAPLGSAPGALLTPDFDAVGNLLNGTGTLHTTPITAVAQTVTSVRWRCIDKMGRKTAVNNATYTIDTVLPTVTLVNLQRTAVSSLAGANVTVDVTWMTDRAGLQYEVRNSGNCSGGLGGGGAATRYTGTVPNAGTNITTTMSVVAGDFPVDGTTYGIKICVFNAIGNVGYQTAAADVTRDDERPQIPNPAVIINTVDALNFALTWNASTDNVGVVAYRIFRRLPAGTYNSVPDYTATANSVTIAMPDTQKYFMRIVPIDAAGNVPASAGAYTEITTKPAINIVVTGLSSGSFNLDDGLSGAVTVSGSMAWTTPLTIGQTYNFTLSNPPVGKVCAIQEKQFGPFSADLTLNINCPDGNMVGGRYQVIPPAPLNYMMYRGNVTTPYLGSVNINGIVIIAGMLYFTQRDTASVSSIWKCNPSTSCASTLTAVANPTTAVFRQMTTDGTNLYVAEGTLATPRVYKYSAINTAQTVPAAVYDLGTAPATSFASGVALDISRNMLYVGMRNIAEVRRLRIDTGNVTTLTSVVSQHEGLAFVGDDLYVATPDNGNCILKATNAHTATALSLYAGACGTTEDYVDGTLLNARFARPHGIVSDGTDLYLAEFTGRRIRRINVRKGTVSTIAGGINGTADGTGIAANFASPFSMASEGRALYLTEGVSMRIRKIIDGGLQGYWPVALGSPEYNYSGSSTAVTTSLTGTLSTTTTDRYGTANNAPRFSGSQYIASATNQVATTATCDVTLAAWYRNDSLATTQGIVYNGNSSTSGYGMLYVPGEGIKILAGTIGWLPGGTGVRSYMPNAGEWTHVAARCRNTNIWTLFINGKKYLEMPFAPNPPSASGAQILIGKESMSAFMNGSVADVRVYNRPLNEGEIHELAQDASSSAAITGIGFSKSASGLLSHYEIFNGTLSDSGAINYPMASGTGTLVDGKDGDPSGAYSFNIASSQYLATAGNTLDGTGNGGEITVAAWVSPATLPAPGSVHIIASRWSNSDINRGYYLEYFNNAGTQQLYWASSGAVSSYSANVPVPLNTWSHVAVTHSGTTATIYLNGIALPTAQTSPRPLTPTPNSTPIHIGRRDDGNHTNGKIDDVRVYNNALNPWQIRELATQIPQGLVARYDFTGDRSDISGYGQDLSNNGVTLTTDRFDSANAAAAFNGSAYFNGTMNNYPLGNSPRTVCAWSRPTTLGGAFSEVVMYGVNASGQGWGFGMDASGGLPNGRLFILDTNGDIAYNRPHGLNIWRHVCATHNGSTEQLFLDGVLIATKNISLATASGALFIGRGVFGPIDYFTGSIDDVRIYNRALSTTEIRTLQQQPNKRIFVTAATPTGNLGGIAGADSICAGDANKPVTSNVFKAMIADSSQRIACMGNDCPSGGVPESNDWVLRTNITYTRPDMVTPIFTADFKAIFVFGSFMNPIAIGTGNVWTGMIPQWATDVSTADDWTNAGTNAVFGDRSSTGSAAIYSFWGTGNASLYCVEQ